VFWHNLVRLWLKTNPFNGEANWSHSICVPIIGLYYLFVHREDLIKAQATQFIWGRFLRPTRAVAAVVMMVLAAGIYFLTRDQGGIALSIIRDLGLFSGVLGLLVLLLDWSMATIFFGLGMFVYGIYPGQNDYLKDLGMVATLFGIVLLLCGWNVMKIAYFPIVFLICALPWPGLVYSWVAEPLSQLAAHVAVDVLKTTGVDSVCSGTKIIIVNANPTLPPRVLNVAEACAGMRSLMTFIAVAGAVAYLSPRPLWQKMIIVFSAIPIAIFCNVMRISGQGLLDHYVSPEWSESFAHQFVGMMMLLPAFFLILLVGFMLDQLFIEEADEDEFRAPIAQRMAPVVPLVNPGGQTSFSPAPVPSAVNKAAQVPVKSIAKTPVASLPPKSPPTPATTPVVPSAAPRSPAQVPTVPTPPAAIPRPAGIAPPRPVTTANARPRQFTPPAAAGPASPVNRPAPRAAIPPNRQTVRPATVPPAVKPPAAVPSEKTKETP
jgi:exosortase